MRGIVTCLAAASLLGAGIAAPASARERHWHHHHDGVDAGDVVGGAIAIGGVAALISAIGSANQQKQDAAVDACSREAESRLGGRVANIAHVAKSKGYYTVEGAVEADAGPGGGFSCTIRNGTIYGFRSSASEA